MTCKCNHDAEVHTENVCLGVKSKDGFHRQCKCKKYVEKVIDPNHAKMLEQERIKRAADVEVVFTIGNCFNVLASKDEYDRTGKTLLYAKGSVKYNGEIHGPFPHKDDNCSCPSFQNGVSLDETIAFQCKHIVAARNQKYMLIDDITDLPPEEAKLILDTLNSGIVSTMERITEQDAKDEVEYLKKSTQRDTRPGVGPLVFGTDWGSS